MEVTYYVRCATSQPIDCVGILHPPFKLKKRKQHLCEEWVKMRQKMVETEIRQKTKTNKIENILRPVRHTSLDSGSKKLNLERRAVGRRQSKPLRLLPFLLIIFQ